jgi:hypothetical protein
MVFSDRSFSDRASGYVLFSYFFFRELFQSNNSCQGCLEHSDPSTLLFTEAQIYVQWRKANRCYSSYKAEMRLFKHSYEGTEHILSTAWTHAT